MTTLFLSCEHGGNDVPKDLLPCFQGNGRILKTHRGLDIGALDLFEHLAPLASKTTHATLSRLCIELNRSEHHPRLFSVFTRDLDAARKQDLLHFHRAYRGEFRERMRKRIKAKDRVLHIGVHSFTPVLDGVERKVDIGLLYDPARKQERAFCLSWRKALQERMPGWVVRMNRPYKGTSDGFPTALRSVFPKNYVGVELEVNQRFAPHGRMDPMIKSILRDTLAELLKTGL